MLDRIVALGYAEPRQIALCALQPSSPARPLSYEPPAIITDKTARNLVRPYSARAIAST